MEGPDRKMKFFGFFEEIFARDKKKDYNCLHLTYARSYLRYKVQRYMES
jgi:hypothetical protein